MPTSTDAERNLLIGFILTDVIRRMRGRRQTMTIEESTWVCRELWGVFGDDAGGWDPLDFAGDFAD